MKMAMIDSNAVLMLLESQAETLKVKDNLELVTYLLSLQDLIIKLAKDSKEQKVIYYNSGWDLVETQRVLLEIEESIQVMDVFIKSLDKLK